MALHTEYSLLKTGFRSQCGMKYEGQRVPADSPPKQSQSIQYDKTAKAGGIKMTMTEIKVDHPEIESKPEKNESKHEKRKLE